MHKIKTQEDFNIFLQILIYNKETFSIDKKANKKSLQIKGKQKRSVFYNSDEQVSRLFWDKKQMSVIPAVHKEIDKYIKSRGLKLKEIEYDKRAMVRNVPFFRSLPDETEMIYVDIKHAYWRVAYILGYIPYTMYKKYLAPEFKLVRNIALSTLASSQERAIYIDGEFQYDIKTENNLRALIYKNIRYFTYNLTGGLADVIGDHCISYRVDGLMTLNDPTVITICREYLKKARMAFEIDMHYKVDDKYYHKANDDELKKF